MLLMKPSKLLSCLTFLIDLSLSHTHTYMHANYTLGKLFLHILTSYVSTFFTLAPTTTDIVSTACSAVVPAQYDVRMGTTVETTVLPLTYTMLYKLCVGSLEVTWAACVVQCHAAQSAK